MSCCTNGLVAVSPGGETIYCTCLKGLEAHMNHIAYLLQEQAETLSRLDAMSKPLPKYLVEAYETVSAEFQRCKAEYDALEERYWAQKRGESINEGD